MDFRWFFQLLLSCHLKELFGQTRSPAAWDERMITWRSEFGMTLGLERSWIPIAKRFCWEFGRLSFILVQKVCNVYLGKFFAECNRQVTTVYTSASWDVQTHFLKNHGSAPHFSPSLCKNQKERSWKFFRSSLHRKYFQELAISVQLSLQKKCALLVERLLTSSPAFNSMDTFLNVPPAEFQPSSEGPHVLFCWTKIVRDMGG